MCYIEENTCKHIEIPSHLTVFFSIPLNKLSSIQTSEPGSVHDSLVFGRSELFRQLNEENFCPFPGAMGVGDSAYKVSLGTFQMN